MMEKSANKVWTQIFKEKIMQGFYSSNFALDSWKMIDFDVERFNKANLYTYMYWNFFFSYFFSNG